MPVSTHVDDLKINKLTEAQFDAAVLSGLIDESQLSIISDAGLSYNDLSDLPDPVQLDTMPTATADTVGQIVQYIGTTTGSYTNGYFYKGINTSGTYSWSRIDVQPQVDPLPSQSGQSGKFLTTNGTSASWATVSTGVSDYDSLTNRPSINGTTLTGNKTSANLGLQDTLVGSGTGQNIKTLNGNSLLGSGNIAIDGLPSQTSQSGKFLTTNGTTASWATVDALPSQASQSGKFLTTNGSAASWASIPEELPSQTGNSGKVLTTNGTTPSWTNQTKVTFRTWGAND